MNNENKYVKLCPFKMQVLETFPFIDADFDALTNYQLLCKVVEYLNITTNNVNIITDIKFFFINTFYNHNFSIGRSYNLFFVRVKYASWYSEKTGDEKGKYYKPYKKQIVEYVQMRNHSNHQSN